MIVFFVSHGRIFYRMIVCLLFTVIMRECKRVLTLVYSPRAASGGHHAHGDVLLQGLHPRPRHERHAHVVARHAQHTRRSRQRLPSQSTVMTSAPVQSVCRDDESAPYLVSVLCDVSAYGVSLPRHRWLLCQRVMTSMLISSICRDVSRRRIGCNRQGATSLAGIP